VHVSAIIAAGGRGTRFGAGAPKQLRSLGGLPILQRSVEAFLRSPRVDDVIVALPPEMAAAPPDYLQGHGTRVRVVDGGERRQDSVANACRAAAGRADLVVIHDAARPLVSQALIDRTIDEAIQSGAAIAALPATDTVKRGNAERVIVGTLPRGEVFLAQTPQAFRIEVIQAALAVPAGDGDATDEAMLAERAGHPVSLVEGERRNIKITTPEDLEMAERLVASPVPALRIGNGYDLHRLVPGRPLVLGGVTVPFEAGLDGHSDADIVCHAVTDAVLGAAGLGDIGRMFPDTAAEWKGADSVKLLAVAVDAVRRAGYAVVNVDVVVIAQRPKLVPHVEAMRANLARVLGVDAAMVSVKGKTNEGVDSMGAGASMAAHAVALVQRV
jgi:2-C-methyl-D-erythritol 4-phosphate cytidylyltransferase/2-C-methyl-D-erythritol 2,4-cyclodiphosphate synthase